jgi:hypothetical protein
MITRLSRRDHRIEIATDSLVKCENTVGRSGREIDTFTDIRAALVAATKSENNGAPLDRWTWHDFRRSFASALGEASIPEAVADAVLNHRQAATRGGVLGVYQRSSRWPEQVRAMELWGDY